MSNWFISAFGGAVADVRQKLIDEAWFGRHPVPPGRDRQTPTQERDEEPRPNPWDLDRGIDR